MPSSTKDKDPTSTKWVEKKKKNRRQEILNAALKVFSEKGYDASKLEDIGEPIGMRGPSLYHYFKNKQDLFVECADRIAAQVTENLERVSTENTKPVKRLRSLFYVQTLGQIRDFYPYYIPIFARLSTRDPVIREYISEIRKRHFSIFQAVAEEARLAGELTQPDWKLALRLAFGSLGSLHQWYDPDGAESPETIAEKVASAMMRLLSHPE